MEPVKFGLYVASARKGPFEVADQAARAEKGGFDSFWFTDHLIDDNIDLIHAETWTSLTLAATRTKKIMLGSGVTDPFRRHPSTIAQTVATLDQISSGRVILGLGAGEAMNLLPFGVNYENPLGMLRESIVIIRKLWQATNKQPAEFNGSFFKLKGAFVQILPVQKPSPRIYVGALSKRTREIAGELADGWLPWINSPASYKNRLNDVKRGAERGGRRLEDLDLVATLDVAVSTNAHKAKVTVMPAGKAALITEQSLLREMGYQIPLPKSTSIRTGIFTRQTMQLLEQTLPLIPDEAVEQISAFGTSDDCISKIEEFIEAGAKHILVSNQGPDEAATLEALSQKIIPYFREQ